MREEIAKSVKGLMTLLEEPHSQEKKIEILDEQIEILEELVKLIQVNWIPRPKRLERALKKKEEIDAEIQYLQNR